MSRYATSIFCLVMLAHLVSYASVIKADQESSSSASARSDPQNDDLKRSQSYLLDGQATNLRNPRAKQSTKSLGLIELTPSLEQQLYQARRLNSADPGSVLEVVRLASDADRYDVAEAPSNRHYPTQSRFSRKWMDGAQILSGIYRTSKTDSNQNNDNLGKGLTGINEDDYQKRFSRGLSTLYGSGSSSTRMSYDPDKDYGTLSGVPASASASIDNQESASRKSLWTSELLRDLLIAQEARNSEKRRRCKVDPNLGVKNPSFCDTDAYFGAADYGVRDVWDSAGR